VRRQPEAMDRMVASPLFAACAKRELALAARTFIERCVTAGTVLMRQGTAGRTFVVLLDGSAIVRIGERTVSRLLPGDFAGELAVLGRRCHSADVVAESDLVVLECTAAELTMLLHEAPSLTRTMLTALATRLCVADRALVA
jgi:CRP-like cAMP-binding protein